VSASASIDGRAPRLGHADVFALIGALSFLAARFLPLLEVPYVCPLKGWLGIPCATCGMTHAFVHLAHGRILDALAASPAGALLAAAAWAYAAADAVRVAAGAPFPEIPARLLRAGAAAGVAVLLGGWAYLLLREVGR
jgi:hypothetical protein